MIIVVRKDSEEPIYQQLRRQLVGAIAVGELRPGDHLPSVRTLAAQLGVNMHTVHKAYALLAEEGFLEMRGSRGAFVAEGPGVPAGPDRAVLQGHLRDAALEWRARGGSQDTFLSAVEETVTTVYREGRRDDLVLTVDEEGHIIGADGTVREDLSATELGG